MSSHADRELWLLNELCEDSLEVPLDHVDVLDRDGIIIDYGVSANFKELRDLIVKREAENQRLRDALRETGELLLDASEGWSEGNMYERGARQALALAGDAAYHERKLSEAGQQEDYGIDDV